MTIYEVNLCVDAGIIDAYREWLAAHVAEMLALPGFESARVMQVEEPAAAPGEVALCVQYRLRDRDALARYLAEHAPRMREDGLARFGGRFRATRRILSSAG